VASETRIPPVRTAAVGYLNARPLTTGLAQDRRFALTTDEPSVVASRLATGEADLGLVPVAEAARLGLTLVSDACVAAEGPVDSVLLFLRTRPGAVRKAALDVASRTSRELARWFLRREGAAPEYVERRPAVALDDPSCDAVLSIGDDALRFAARGLPRVDLAEAWTRAYGLPFVFAAWGARPEVLTERPWLAARLSAARDEGLARLDDYAREAAAGPAEAAAATVYLRKRLRYVLGPAERRGLARFLTEASLPPFG
jgi:predicted solute-binding protein